MDVTRNTATFPVADLFRPLRDLVAVLRDANARRAVYNRTVADLSALSTRELHDIGLTRSDIPAFARRAAAQN
ncbi:DUF1127 domain-containing protein [Falsirhodobacter algicola]|uniref:DUF1127 domain-containing protein n=1 Tax=Falsirhodobacter algicola TaxID=2692330 RepID=A0A8J8MRR8_9RHOB|nr:DUF1127 domain-containing protein [Falsirhodobacter algicola]QUS35257.1 DUF1127 domain-containing protein [Falsirhodobacter algicola]